MTNKRGASQPDSEEAKADDNDVMYGDEMDNDDDDDKNHDDEEMEDKSDEGTEEAEGTALEPSTLAKKEMMLRSGRRKRRRSKETTGLTPPDTSRKSKRPKKPMQNTQSTQSYIVENGDTQRKPAAVDSPVAKAVNDKSSATLDTNIAQAYTDGKSTLEATNGDNRTSSPARLSDARRISYSQQPSHIPPNIPTDANGISDHPKKNSDHTRNEAQSDQSKIDVCPPKPVPPVQELNRSNGNQIDDLVVTESSTPQDTEMEERDTDEHNIQGGKSTEEIEVNDDVDAQEIPEQETTETTSSTWGSRLLLVACFLVLSVMSVCLVLPSTMKLTEYLIPLDVSILPPPPKILQQPIQINEDVIIEPEETLSKELEIFNDDLLDELKKLKEAEDEFSSSTQDLSTYYNKVMDRFQETKELLQNRGKLLQNREVEVKGKLDELIELEELLQSHESNNNDQHDQIRGMTQRILRKTLVDTSSITLWGFPDNYNTDCDLDDHGVLEKDDEEIEPRLLTQLLEEKESSLTLRSTITAEKFIGGAVAEDRVRKWIESQIKKAINDDDDATEALKEINYLVKKLSESVSDVVEKDDGFSNIDLLVTEIVESRLEIDRADTTGILDHASLINGAETIYGGKRGTSKSLIDDLPVFNRILQNANLRFYGFGPEAALTVTYPPNTLGQCWSFQQTPLKEQLKEKQLYQNDDSVPDDFKRGNFGTLTVRLPRPIYVESVIIEHPSKLFTGQSDSAIRSFRIVGYEDDMASSKAWSLGSFEYSVQKNKQNDFLQEFEVANTVYGKEIPRLHTISLAIDSNYGHEYACLYRFRVHGYEE
mmetsp:Transcript_65707/g.73310  ORF Transcript_65707/g.73310 Transcript_65707/m.73310 type:complete len:823 (+) Transcript_65707:94-2562(+)